MNFVNRPTSTQRNAKCCDSLRLARFYIPLCYQLKSYSGVFLEKKSSREQTPAQSRGSNATEAGDGVEGGSPPSTARSL